MFLLDFLWSGKENDSADSIVCGWNVSSKHLITTTTSFTITRRTDSATSHVFFRHMFTNDAISWVILGSIKMNKEDTTSSSRIFIKIMMQEMIESMGLKTLAERFKDEEVRTACKNMFPTDNPKDTCFSINYFTSIGLGILTEDMRE